MQIHAKGQDDDLNRILAIIADIARKSAGGSYIYRGETRCWERVSSSLYREYEGVSVRGRRDMNTIQEEELMNARRFTRETDENVILTELQHYGGNTNLIDFTTDYLIALFFACDGNHTQDGRVILLQRTGEINAHIYEPSSPLNRVIAQKSVFVRPPDGFVEPEELVIIPLDLKKPMLDYLGKHHGISTESIYNDLHGFIRNKAIHREAFKNHVAGVASRDKQDFQQAIELFTKAVDLNPQLVFAYVYRGDTYQYGTGDYDSALADYNTAIRLYPNNMNAVVYVSRGNAYYHKREYDPAIADYSRAVTLNPDNSDIYAYRGNAHYYKGSLELALSDYSTAITLNPDNANAFYYRGIYWLTQADWQRARTDLDKATNLGLDVRSLFLNTYESVSTFNQYCLAEVPQDIGEVLGG